MISTKEGLLKIDGILPEIIQDTVSILSGLYKLFIEKYGEEKANEYFVRIGKISTITDEEERCSQLKTFVCEAIEKMMENAPPSLKTVLKQALEELKEGEE